MTMQTKGRRLIRLDEVRNRTGESTASIYRKMKDGLFPKSVALGVNMRAWVEDEIDEHDARLIEARDKGEDHHLRGIHPGIGKGRPKRDAA
jgi:prophage regulatory protein